MIKEPSTAERATTSNRHRLSVGPLDLPPRLLLGPGPSNCPPRVLEALSKQQIGHLDPAFVALMDEVKELLRYLWQTDNPITLPVSGTGSAGMEAAFANMVEPGDVVVVGCAGYFSQRMATIAERYHADVRRMEKPWGEVWQLSEIEEELDKHKPAILALVHGETSSGALQPIEGVSELCHARDCLLVVDCVPTLGACEFYTDDWGIDVAYSGSQKSLSCPPGLAPLTVGPRAAAKLEARKVPVANWYLDLTLLGGYWSGSTRAYHHTAPINLNYALREGLRIVAEEGLDACWRRHRETAEFLWEGLKEMGLECHVPRQYRMESVTTVRVPDGIDATAVTTKLREEHNIEIAGGFGELAGKVWRIGTMGYNSRRENVVQCLVALKQVLAELD